MTVHLPLFVDKTILPTNKYHVSFSEVKLNNECGWKGKLVYVDGHREGDTEHTVYGQRVHAALQDWLLIKDSVWFDWTERIEACQKEVLEAFKVLNFAPTDNALAKDWIAPVEGMLQLVPSWMDLQFPGWKTVASELYLFEPIEGQTNKWFKGFVDAVIKVPKQPRKGSSKVEPGLIYWVLDWKTTSWGWNAEKKQDKYQRMQLALYKHFISIKLGIPLEDIRCGFVLLKRTAKNADHCELIEVSVGEKTRQDAVDLVNLTINLIAKKYYLKNRNSCRWCKFKGTELCP